MSANVDETVSTRTVLDAILSGSESGVLTLPSGLPVSIRRMKVRELFLFVTAVSTGLGGNLSFLLAAAETNIEDFSQQVMTLALMAMPSAPEQTLEWVRQMVEPTEDLTTSDRARFYDYMSNPSVQDLTALLKGVLAQEKDEFSLLGKELVSVVTMLNDGATPTVETPAETPAEESETPGQLSLI